MPRLAWALLFTLCLALPLCAQAVSVYHIAPAGNDSAAGTASAPWKTFTFALPKLTPGDTLQVHDGTYTVSAHGQFYAGCAGSQYGSGAKDGTAAAPITVRAQHERQALIQGSGTNVVALDGCEYWVIEGLYVRNVDVQTSGWDGSGIVLQSSHHIALVRNLVYGPNAWFNSHGIALYNTHQSLVEENEVYYVTRHGIIVGDAAIPGDGNVVRRNYLHSRDHDSMPGGYTCAGSCENHRGDEGISCYPCKNSIIENNVVEDFDGPYTIQGKMQPFNNKYLGNVSIASGGFGAGARSEMAPNSADQMPTGTVYEHNVAYHVDAWAGFNCRVCKNTRMTNNTVIDTIATNTPLGVNWDISCGTACGEGGDGQLSNYATNMLVVNAKGPAFNVSQVPTWGVDYLVSFGNAASAPALSDPHYTHVSTANPQMGDCKVYLPASSPAKGVGKDGADVGANILYRYQAGALTTIPLWDPATGMFPCGAVVPGVNDVAGKSCRDVHERLHVGTAGCPLPYGAPSGGTRLSWKAPADGGTPTSYDITRDDALLASVPATTLTYTDQTPGWACYSVVAKNAVGATPTEPVCPQVQAAPGMPQELTVTPPARSRGEHRGRRESDQAP